MERTEVRAEKKRLQVNSAAVSDRCNNPIIVEKFNDRGQI